MLLNRRFESVRLVDPVTGTDKVGEYAVENGIGRFTPRANRVARYLLVPGLRDVHVHFRDPGTPEAETRQSGAAAAAAGGFTCVTTMPNTTPAGDSIEWVRTQIEDRDIPVRIAPSACITAGRKGRELADLESLAKAGAVAFTDDGGYVADGELMRKAMTIAARLGKPVMEHAVDPDILDGGVMYDGRIARRHRLKVMPPEAEIEAVRRDIGLARETGCALHIQHISTAGAVELVRDAQREGLPVTAEATPHHLLLATDDMIANDANWKMAPPLGQPDDRAAIRRAVMDGTIGLFATDHAPHHADRKQGGFAVAANGIVGLETAVAVTWQAMVLEEGMPVMEWVKRWTVGPAMLIGEKPHSLLSESLADFALIDTAAKLVVRPETFRSLSCNQPFTGMRFAAWPVLTVMEGRLTYER